MRTKPLPVGVQVGQSCPELQNALRKLRLARGECLFRATTAAKAKGDHISVEKSDVFNQQTCHSLPISMCNGWITPHARRQRSPSRGYSQRSTENSFVLDEARCLWSRARSLLSGIDC